MKHKLNKESLENLQHDLVLPEDIIEGEFSVIPKSKLIIVKKRLRKLSSNILTSMEERIKIPEIIRNTNEAFNSSQSNENVINDLIDCLDGNKAKMFQECRYNFESEKSKDANLSLEKYCIIFCEKFDFNTTAIFRDFF